jgi:hypothetical protein
MKQEHYTAKQYNQSVALSETQEQIAVVKHLDMVKYDGRPLRFSAIPNGGKRDAKTAAILKHMGVKPGVMDLLIFDTPPNYPLMKGAALEMKKRTGGVVSDEQQDWLDYFDKNSWVTGVAHGQDEAIELLREWGYLR